jgi:ribosome-binding protein aMBF1 (putative translation factor)
MSLGSLIAKARKDAGLSLEDLAAKTNIRINVLSEIEKDDFSHCGGETYARGHVRNIAAILKSRVVKRARLKICLLKIVSCVYQPKLAKSHGKFL